MSLNGGLQTQLPKLNGRNYYHWSIQMKVLFESQEIWSVIENGITEPVDPSKSTAEENKELRESKKKDKKALFLIYQAVDELIFERISLSSSSKDAWDMLFNTYRGEEKVKIVRLQTLRCEFDNLKMKDSETIEEYYNRVIFLVNQLHVNGENIEDRRIVEKILRSLTRKFEYVVVAIEESKDISTITLENLIGTLQSHELRMRQFDDTTTEQAFQTLCKINGKNPVSMLDDIKNSVNFGEGTSREQEMKSRTWIPQSEKECYYCHKKGHIMKFCRKKQQDEIQNGKEDAKFMQDCKDTMFMMLEEAKEKKDVCDISDIKEDQISDFMIDDLKFEKMIAVLGEVQRETSNLSEFKEEGVDVDDLPIEWCRGDGYTSMDETLH